MLIDRLIKEVKIELKEAYKLLDELGSSDQKNFQKSQREQTDFSNEELLFETTKEIIIDQKSLLSNLKADDLASVISKVEDRYTVCPSCENDLEKNHRIIRLPHQSLLYIKENPIAPLEIVIVDICPCCDYILNFKFFKGYEAQQLYELLIDDLSDTKFEFKEKLKV